MSVDKDAIFLKQKFLKIASRIRRRDPYLDCTNFRPFDFVSTRFQKRNHYYGEPIPYCVWVFGGHSRERYNAAPGDSLMAKIPFLPSNHQPDFIPDPEPTLRTGVCALTSAALAYLPATVSVQRTA
jgi:hypothetical protein